MPFISLWTIDEVEKMPGFHVRFVHSDSMTFAHWTIRAGAVLPEHSHPHEQVATILEGKFELRIGDEAQLLEPNMVAVVPSNAAHSGRAVTNCRMIDAFYPIREDYR